MKSRTQAVCWPQADPLRARPLSSNIMICFLIRTRNEANTVSAGIIISLQIQRFFPKFFLSFSVSPILVYNRQHNNCKTKLIIQPHTQKKTPQKMSNFYMVGSQMFPCTVMIVQVRNLQHTAWICTIISKPEYSSKPCL